MKFNLLGKLFLLLLFFYSCETQAQLSEINGSVASAHPIATKAGMDILASGGNAFDAAIAVAATLNVVEPMMSGIGGYGTILIYDAIGKQIRFLNPSGRFPIKTNTDLMRTPTPDFIKNRFGSKSISTPGNLNAWAEMHSKYGKMDWSHLFTPAINYAEIGYVISPTTARWIKIAFENFSTYTKSFYGNSGKPLKAGDLLIQKDLASSFKLIASEGVDPFYQGSIAEAINSEMNKVGGFLSIEDLRNNKAEWWEPLKFEYREYEVYTASLPANSFAAFVNLGLMQQIPSKNLEHNSADYLHLFAEIVSVK